MASLPLSHVSLPIGIGPFDDGDRPVGRTESRPWPDYSLLLYDGNGAAAATRRPISAGHYTQKMISGRGIDVGYPEGKCRAKLCKDWMKDLKDPLFLFLEGVKKEWHVYLWSG